MLGRTWRRTVQSLWFLPGTMVVGFGALAFGLVEVDRRFGLDADLLFGGDAGAGRTVLSVIAGSLITVAGVSLSLTLLVLQLASSQFSPRVLPGFLGDRFTQVTVGSFVGIFTYSLITLRAVGGGFVPRLSITVASALGVVAVIVLVAFIHHVSQLIQVSGIAARIGAATVRQVERIYPEPFGDGVDEDGDALLVEWRRLGDPRIVRPSRSGYVEEIATDRLASRLDGLAARVHFAVFPGEFVTTGDVLAEVWTHDAETAARGVSTAFGIADERSPTLDVGFGIRQLTDIALRALSPALNDPTTAQTCIGYLRAILEALTGRDLPPRVRRFDGCELVVIAERRAFEDHLLPLVEIGRSCGDAVEVTAALLDTCASVADRARAAGADDRVDAALAVASTIARQSSRRSPRGSDRGRIVEAVPYGA